MNTSDAELVEGIVAGDESAFTAFFRRHEPGVRNTLLRMIREPSYAEDILQETFLQVWNRATQYDPTRASPEAWLMLIARSRALDLLRKRRIGGLSADYDPSVTADPSLHLERDETSHMVQSAIALLPADQREAIRLAFLAGMTHEQISGLLGLPLGTVKTRIRLGIRRLRGLLPEGQQ